MAAATYQYSIENLGCAGCAMKMEEGIGNFDEVTSASINFATKTLFITTEGVVSADLFNRMNSLIGQIEPDAHLNSERADEDGEILDHGHQRGETWGLWKLIIPIVLFAGSFAFKESGYSVPMLLLAYGISGYGVIWQAIKNTLRFEVFDENFLMTIASVGAILIGELSEGVAVMIFYSVGEYMQDLAVDRSRKSIAALMDIRPEFANLVRGDSVVKVDPNTVRVGDEIVVKAGERVPLDGTVVSGDGALDTSALTGESLPREVEIGDEVLSGSINKSSLIRIKVDKPYEDSAVSKILQLVEESGAKKAATEKFITKFARYYTPVVVGAAALLAVVPPLITGGTQSEWIYRSLVFLVASCPCALVVSIPLGFFAGIGKASKSGILVKGGNYLESMNSADCFVFDKTGTLTEGVFKVSVINHVEWVSPEEVLKIAATAEQFSDHPIAASIRNAYGGEVPKGHPELVEDISGMGISMTFEGEKLLAGNEKLMNSYGIEYCRSKDLGTVVYLALNGNFIGSIVISDKIKPEAQNAIRELKSQGIEHFTILTGDNKSIAEKVAFKLGITEVFSELLPQDKVGIVEEKLSKRDNGSLVFVGDGINDAPVLTLADVGIAMGRIGTDAAIEAADIVIMKDDLSKLSELITISKKTMRIILQNVVFALGFKLLVLILGATGQVGMWMAVFADTGVAIIAILNSIRILR